MDGRQFDDLSRRIGGSPLSRLPRRGLIAALGGATVASALHLDDDSEAKKNNKNNNKNKKCKKEGKKCDKKKCKKQDKKCCCNNLKCKDSICTGSSGSCPTKVSFENTFVSSGSAALSAPWGVTFDSSQVYVTDTGHSKIKTFSANGSNLNDEFGSNGYGSEEFQTPQGIAYQSGKNRLAISDKAQTTNPTRKLRRFSTDGALSNSICPADLTQPTGVTVDGSDRIWAVDFTIPGEIFLFDSNGNPLANWTPSGSGQLSGPQGIAVYKDSQNNATYVYVTDSGNNRVVKFEYTGNSSSGLAYVASAGSGGDGSSNFNTPVGISLDSCGNLWVADQVNNRVQVLDKNLNFKTRFTASMNRPTGVAVNGSTLYVVNNVGNNVQRFSLSQS